MAISWRRRAGIADAREWSLTAQGDTLEVGFRGVRKVVLEVDPSREGGA
jgi:hypothetical protein